MSSSSKSTAQISIEAQLGVNVRVIDSAFTTVASASSEPLSEAFEPGIYTIRWTAGDTAAQRVVRLREGDHLKTGDSGLIPGAAPSEDIPLAGRQLAALIREVDRRNPKTRFVIFVCANDMRTTSDVGKDVQLRSFDEGSDSQAQRSLTTFDAKDGWSALHLECKPGLHLLRYLNSERKRIEQTIFAPPGRSTIIWLRYGTAYTAEGKFAEGQFRARRGIDASRTRIVSIAPFEPASALRDRFLLASSLLTDVAVRKGELINALVNGLQNVHDPFIRLYAATVLLTRPLSPEGIWAELPDEPLALPHQNAMIARRLLDSEFVDAEQWPDAICAHWRLNLAGTDSGVGYSHKLPAPPMLESAWRWATAWSVRHPESLDPVRSPAIAAVTKGQERTSPWLTWRSRDLRTKPGANSSGLRPELVEAGIRTIGELAAEVEVHSKRAGIANSVSQGTLDFVRMTSRLGSTSQWSVGNDQLFSRLAGATGLPASELVLKANTALEEMRQLPAPDVDAATSDPNKGAFGGTPNANGLCLSLASFRKSNNPDYLALDFEVQMDSGVQIGGPFTFVLHPTFSPSRVAVAAIDNVARYTAFAWGSFTLGVEAPDGTRLELDLSHDRRLPQWFRDR